MALGAACREHLSWRERLSWLQTLQECLRAAGDARDLDLGHEARGATEARQVNESLFPALAAVSGSPSPNGAPHPSRADKETVLGWVEQRVAYVQGAYEQGECQADRNGALLVVTESKEALRAARIWTRLAEILERELSHPSDEKEDFRPRLNPLLHELSRDGADGGAGRS